MIAAPPPRWPELPTDGWASTLSKLHLWTQMIGKIRMAHDASVNHSWGVVLHVTPRGLGTPLIPYDGLGFSIDVDVHDGVLRIETSHGDRRELLLDDRTVAAFHAELVRAMDDLSIPLTISTMPSEIPDAIAFDRDERDLPDVADHARAFHSGLVQADR